MSTEPQAETARSPFEIIDELNAEITSLHKRIEELREERNAATAAGHKWKDEAKRLQSVTEGLMDTLNGMTVEKARLEGYIDRVREFDPQPEPVMVPQVLNNPSRRLDDSYGYTPYSKGQEPWYRRNIRKYE
jgi:chromosome segregation ATPase